MTQQSDYMPQTKEERQIAAAMVLVNDAIKIIQDKNPALPATALNVGLLNMGIRMGVELVGAQRVADYLRSAAYTIDGSADATAPQCMIEETRAAHAGYTAPFAADDAGAIRDATGRVCGTHSDPRTAAELAAELNRDGCISSLDA